MKKIQYQTMSKGNRSEYIRNIFLVMSRVSDIAIEMIINADLVERYTDRTITYCIARLDELPESKGNLTTDILESIDSKYRLCTPTEAIDFIISRPQNRLFKDCGNHLRIATSPIRHKDGESIFDLSGPERDCYLGSRHSNNDTWSDYDEFVFVEDVEK
jgi:hypothetical protein